MPSSISFNDVDQQIAVIKQTSPMNIRKSKLVHNTMYFGIRMAACKATYKANKKYSRIK